jgi:DNA recombination protein RmuC
MQLNDSLLLGLGSLQFFSLIFLVFLLKKTKKQTQIWQTSFSQFQDSWLARVFEHDKLQQQNTQEHLIRQMQDIRSQIGQYMQQQNQSLSLHLQSMSQDTQIHLKTMTELMQTKLSEGFEKTSTTFHDVLQRLVMIDEAQKKISELSSHVVNLQDILVDKRSRGAFGEVQLQTLIANMLPAQHYRIQHTLSNQKRADCLLLLPPPTGSIVIDAKFPLENFQKLMNLPSHSPERKQIQSLFKQDIQKHIKDVAEKYILPPETAEGALLFIPAEAIFAEIHANYPELIELSHRLNVWLVSPSTLMAVLTTAKAVLKDDATRQQIHIIQKHLLALSQDFQRFDKRMDKLSKHLDQAHQDMSDVQISAKKITQQFQKIEAVEISQESNKLLQEREEMVEHHT